MKKWYFLALIILFIPLVSAVKVATSTYEIECTPEISTIQYNGFNQECTYLWKGSTTIVEDVVYCFNDTLIYGKVSYLNNERFQDITNLFTYKKIVELDKPHCYYIENVTFAPQQKYDVKINYFSKGYPKWDTYFGDVNDYRVDLKLDPIFNNTLYEIGTNRSSSYNWAANSTYTYSGFPGGSSTISAYSWSIDIFNRTIFYRESNGVIDNQGANYLINDAASGTSNYANYNWNLERTYINILDIYTNITYQQSNSINGRCSSFNWTFFYVDGDISNSATQSCSNIATTQNVVPLQKEIRDIYLYGKLDTGSPQSSQELRYSNITIYRKNNNSISYGFMASNPIQLSNNVTTYNISANGFGNYSMNLSLNNGTNWTYITTFTNYTWLYANSNILKYVVYLNGSGSYMTNFSINLGPDNLIAPTLQYSDIQPAGLNHTFSILMSTNSTANESFTTNCNVANANFTCIVSNFSVINNYTLPVKFTSNSSTPDGVYMGYLNITRTFDNMVFQLNFSLGVSTTFGVPVLNTISPLTTTMSSTDTQVLNFNLSNNGTYNISSCSCSLSNSFVGFGFYSCSQGFTLIPNQSIIYNLTFTNPNTGSYSGYMSVQCSSTAGGAIMTASNTPLLVLTSTSGSGSTTSGGGGGGAVIVNAGNGTFEITPNILDTYFVITNFDANKQNIWNYTFITTKLLTSCSIDNDFTCKIQDNKVIVSKDYGQTDYITAYDTAQLTIVSGSDTITKTISVRTINLAYYLPVNINIGDSIFTRETNGTGIYLFTTFLALMLIVYLITKVAK